MFDKNILSAIKKKLEQNLRDQVDDSIKKLKEDYEHNNYITRAVIKKNDAGGLNIRLQLNFEPIDASDQNIPAVFEYGGILHKQTPDGPVMVDIEPGFYIRRNFGARST